MPRARCRRGLPALPLKHFLAAALVLGRPAVGGGKIKVAARKPEPQASDVEKLAALAAGRRSDATPAAAGKGGADDIVTAAVGVDGFDAAGHSAAAGPFPETGGLDNARWGGTEKEHFDRALKDALDNIGDAARDAAAGGGSGGGGTPAASAPGAEGIKLDASNVQLTAEEQRRLDEKHIPSFGAPPGATSSDAPIPGGKKFMVGGKPIYFPADFHTDPNAELKRKLLSLEFDPTSKEGALHMVSAVDMHASYARAWRGRQEGSTPGRTPEPPRDGDLEPVLALFGRAMDAALEGVDMYSGMRELRGAILGAGNLNAVNVTSFRRFEEVVAADVQSQLAHFGVMRQAGEDFELRNRFSFYREDVTGLVPSFHWRCENLFGIADTADEAYEILGKYMSGGSFLPRHLRYDTVGNMSLRYVPRSDVIVVNLLLHELGPLFIQHLGSEMDRLTSHKWPGAGADLYRKLGMGAGDAVQRVTKYFVKRLLRLIRQRRTRTVVLVLSQGRTVEWREQEGEEPSRMVKRRAHADQQWIDMLKGADFGSPRVFFEESAQRVAARWARTGAKQWREEEIAITGIEYGEDMSQAEWLKALTAGSYNPYAVDPAQDDDPNMGL